MILGTFVSKASFDVVLLLDEKPLYRAFDNDLNGFKELKRWLHKAAATHVHACMEATGSYGDALAEFLYSSGHAVSVVNPARIYSYARSRLSRNKTDKGDAQLIALFCQNEKPQVWHPSPPEVKELRALVRRLEDLVQMRVQENNRSKANAHPAVQASLAQMLTSLDTQVKALRKAVREHVRAHPVLLRQFELLMSIVGIGDKTAYKLLAEIDVANFKDAKALAAFLGLTPKHHTSGTSIRGRPKLSKTGSSSLRKALYFPAMAALRTCPSMQAFGARLSAKGKPKMVVIGAIMRKLVHIVYGVLKHSSPYSTRWAFTCS
jgi:transposase